MNAKHRIAAGVVLAAIALIAYKPVTNFAGNKVASQGYTLEAGGLYPKAIYNLRTAIRLKPNDPEIHSHLSWCLYKDGNLGDAIREAREAARLDPNNMERHYYLAGYWNEAGHVGQAIVEAREAVR